jgi:hypothetical protein
MITKRTATTACVYDVVGREKENWDENSLTVILKKDYLSLKPVCFIVVFFFFFFWKIVIFENVGHFQFNSDNDLKAFSTAQTAFQVEKSIHISLFLSFNNYCCLASTTNKLIRERLPFVIRINKPTSSRDTFINEKNNTNHFYSPMIQQQI